MSENQKNTSKTIKKIIKEILRIVVVFGPLLYIAQYFELYPINKLSITYLSLLFVGLYLLRYSDYPNKKLGPLICFFGLFLIGYGLSQSLLLTKIDFALKIAPIKLQNKVFLKSFQIKSTELINSLSKTLLWSFTFVSITSLLAYLTYLSKKTEPIIDWVLGSQKKILVSSFYLLLHFYYLRPQLFTQLRNLPATTIEWIILLFFIAAVFKNFNSHLRRYLGKKPRSLEFSQHSQEIKQYESTEIKELEETQKDFVEKNEKEPLLVEVIKRLNKKNYSTKQISYLITPLTQYKQKPIPEHGFEWWKKRIKQKNKQKRKKALNKQIDYIKMAEKGKNPRRIYKKYR